MAADAGSGVSSVMQSVRGKVAMSAYTVAMVAAAVPMLAAALLALSGQMTFAFDANAFVASPFSWIAALATFAAMAAMVLAQVGLMHRNLESALSEQQSRMDALALTNLRLEREIAARTHMEAELRGQSALLQSILDNLPGGVSVFDCELRLVACNQSFRRLLDLPDELFAEPHPAFEAIIRFNAARGEYGNENLERIVGSILQRARHPVPHLFERQRPNGTVLEVRGAPLPDGGFVTIYADVTARKQSERELLRLHERSSLALETVGLGIFDWDAEKDEVLADARVFEIFGATAEGKNGRFDDWAAYLHPEDRETTIRRVRQTLRGKATDAKLTCRIVRPDGGVRYLEVHHHIVRDARGRALRLIGADFDITERKETEERLLLAEKVFDSSPVAIMITDRQNRIVSVNAAFTRITGYAAGEVLGRDPGVFGSGLHDAEFFARMWRALGDSDAWQGEIWDRRKCGEIYPKWMSINVVRDRDDTSRMHYVAIFSDITERKRAEEHIHHLAHHDPLTTLPNRMELQARLAQSIAEADRNQRSVAVMFLDLDRFKEVNDTLGHHVGDLLLIEVARRLRQTVRASDTVARLGGDEFVVVLPALETPNVAATVASGILDALRRPHLIEGQVVHGTPSIGVSIYPQDGGDVDTVMKYADAAMYHAKETGRNDFKFFSPELNRAAMDRVALERELREALQCDQFVLHYLPRFDRGGRLTGLEALLRWNRPGQGLELPGSFIPIAAESQLIVEIGDWVLGAVVRQLRCWLDAGIRAPAVAINLAARQLRLAILPGRVAEVLRGVDLPADLLEFEITETMTTENPQRVALVLGELRNMGISLAIDDFGTGYSSLSDLKRLPFDRLKIDRSLVAEIAHDSNELAVARGCIALAHSLKLKVVAEGVETAEQFAFLKHADCDEFQGFHFAQPMPAAEIEAFLQPSRDPVCS